MGKSTPKIPVDAFKMSLMFGICHGVVNVFHRIFVREKSVWNGRRCGARTVYIDQPEVFGGHLKEGGVQGFVYVQPGAPSQLMHEHVAQKQGGPADEMPGYRDIATISFTEGWADPDITPNPPKGDKKNPGFDGPGFYWVSGAPYLPGIWVEVERMPKPFLPEYARIYRGTVEDEDAAKAATDYDYCFALTWDEEIGTPGPQPDLNPWVDGVQDFDGDGVSDSRADYYYTLIAKFCEKLTAEGHGDNQITMWFKKGGGAVDDYSLDVFGSPGSLQNDSWNHPSFSDASHFLKVGPFAASTVDTVSGYPFAIPRGTDMGDHSNNSPFYAAPGGLFDAIVADHDAGNSFDYVFHINQFVEENRVNKFGSTPEFKYQTFHEMKADYHRMAEAFRDRCISFRFLAYYDFHITIAALSADAEDTVTWDVLYMISGAEKHAFTSVAEYKANGWYGPYIDVLHSSFAWENFHSRFHGYSAAEFESSGLYRTDLSNRYSDPITAEFADFILNNDDYEDPFDVGGGGDAWLEYFFTRGRVLRDYYDANPVHIIVECLTNPDWGMGYLMSALNLGSFATAAKTLYDERFGISFKWIEQAAIETIVQEVLDHIEAALFIDPASGLFEIVLIRADYDESTLQVLDPTNCTVLGMSQRVASEAVNEITVTWTNPENEQDETITIQDLGAIVAAGGRINPETRGYYGIRRADLATEVCARDIRSAAAPITTADVEVDRAFWRTVPAQLFKLVYPEYGIEAADPLIMRVVSADYGKPGQSKIKLGLSEDVFSLSPHFYDIAPGTALPDPDVPPSEADAQQVMTLPYFLVYNAVAGAISDAVYPDALAGVLVAESDSGATSFNLYGEVPDTLGGTETENLGERDLLAHGLLVNALAWEAESTVTDWGTPSNGTGPVAGGFVLIGDPSHIEAERELCLITSVVSEVYTLSRGVLDTVPRAWPVGTEVWFFSTSDDFADLELRAEGEDVDYTAQVIGLSGVLPLSSITPIPTYTLTARPWRPTRPADVKIDGKAFQDVFYATVPATVDITWADRNRVTENSVPLAWTDAGIAVEAGQTVEVDVFDEGDVLLHTFTGLTGGSASLDETQFSNTGTGYIRVYSKRDGLRSLQYYEARVDTRANSGYGFDYGNNYGGGS